MPRRLTFCVHHPIEHLRHDPARCTFFRLGVLLRCRQIEDEIRFDQGASIRLV